MYKNENSDEKNLPHVKYIKEQILNNCNDDIYIISFKNKKNFIYVRLCYRGLFVT